MFEAGERTDEKPAGAVLPETVADRHSTCLILFFWSLKGRVVER